MTELLVSVRSAAEAAKALAAGAAVLDVKEPAHGSLGRAADEVRRAVLAEVAGRVLVSVALGDLGDDGVGDLAGVSFAKWGLAGCGRDWEQGLRRARAAVETGGTCRMVLAAYSDWRRAGAPPPGDLLHFALRERLAALLLDTWAKDGSTLLDWLSQGELAELCASCRAAGVRIALAGSLGRRQIETLLPLRPDWFAVRGAVCQGGRRESIDETLVRDLVALTRATPAG